MVLCWSFACSAYGDSALVFSFGGGLSLGRTCVAKEDCYTKFLSRLPLCKLVERWWRNLHVSLMRTVVFGDLLGSMLYCKSIGQFSDI